MLTRRFGMCLLILVVAFLGVTSSARAGVILAVDIGPGPIQAGFSPFPGGVSIPSPVSVSYGDITVTIDGASSHSLVGRDRGAVAGGGTFTQSDLLRDFLASRDGETLIATLTGLTPNAVYSVQLWSFDSIGLSFPPGAFTLDDWKVNGVIVEQDYSYAGHGSPQSNTDYSFTFTTNADALGQIQIQGIPQNARDGVRINGLRLSDGLVTSAVPEPASLVLIAIGMLTQTAYKRVNASQQRRHNQ